MTKKIEHILGLDALPITRVDDQENKNLQNYEQIETDFNVAREGNYEALEIAKKAMEDMLLIAQSSQHPKAYEVLNAFLKTYSEIASNSVDLQLKKKRLQPKDQAPSESNQTINNLFVGSTEELQKMLENIRKEKDV